VTASLFLSGPCGLAVHRAFLLPFPSYVLPRTPVPLLPRFGGRAPRPFFAFTSSLPFLCFVDLFPLAREGRDETG